MSADKVYIWLQEGEEEGQADCGCRLVRSWDDGNPAFIMCAGHLAQDKLLTALKAIVDNREKCFIPNDVEGLFAWDEKARAAIAEAESGVVRLHGETADEWADRMFEYEFCSTCGKDKQDHDIIEFLGNWLTRCKSKDYRPENLPEKAAEFHLTEKQETDYLKKPLGCPACQSVDVSMGPLQSDGTVAWAENSCENCGLLWHDVYTLTKVETLNLR